MSIAPDDLRAAVAAGVLSEAQAARLAALAQSRRGARENLAPGDEPFELFKGFNEIFIVVGLVILTTAGSAPWGPVGRAPRSAGSRRRDGASAPGRDLGARSCGLSNTSCAAAAWSRPPSPVGPLGGQRRRARRRLRAAFMWRRPTTQPRPAASRSPPGASLCWLRFRVPFAMAMIALGLFATRLVLAAARAGTPATPQDLFLLSAGGPFAWITLALRPRGSSPPHGLDLSDPHRVSRPAAQGFWLHVGRGACAGQHRWRSRVLAQGPPRPTPLLDVFLALIALVAVVMTGAASSSQASATASRSPAPSRLGRQRA
jgi:hypothetical protein